jgi:hypothetical protein
MPLLPSSFKTWCQVNGITFDGVRVGRSRFDGGGEGVLAERDLTGGNDGPLMTVPRDMILSRERVELQAKSDKWLREVLDATGEYAKVSPFFILSSDYSSISFPLACQVSKDAP